MGVITDNATKPPRWTVEWVKSLDFQQKKALTKVYTFEETITEPDDLETVVRQREPSNVACERYYSQREMQRKFGAALRPSSQPEEEYQQP